MSLLTPDRILVLGVSGSGKSTATRQLATAISAEPFDFDDHVLWAAASEAAWTHRSPREQRRRAESIVSHRRWVMAGLGNECKEIILSRTDLIVYLAYSHRVTLSRLLSRSLRRVLLREQACNGNRESWRQLFSRDSIIWWWWQSRNRPRTEIPRLEADPASPDMIVLRRPQDLVRWAAILAEASAK
jgi:adenylate kinase family enzyme